MQKPKLKQLHQFFSQEEIRTAIGRGIAQSAVWNQVAGDHRDDSEGIEEMVDDIIDEVMQEAKNDT